MISCVLFFFAVTTTQFTFDEVICNSSYAYGKGGAYLSWTDLSNSNAYYKVFQGTVNSNNEWSEWKQISTYRKGSQLNVLNVYPSQIDGFEGQATLNAGRHDTSSASFTFGNDPTQHLLPSSAALKVILEGGTMTTENEVINFEPYGVDPRTGEQAICVIPISINDFEFSVKANPYFIYDYDVIFFGSSRYSSGYNILTTTATNVVAEYIKKGYGVFAGYDSIEANFFMNGNAESLLAIRDLFGVKIFGVDKTLNGENISYAYHLGISLRVLHNGLITNYPYEIGQKDTTFSISIIGASTAASGDVWVSFNNNVNRDEFGLLHGFT